MLINLLKKIPIYAVFALYSMSIWADAVLTSDGKLSISHLSYEVAEAQSLWANFEYVSTGEDGTVILKLTEYGSYEGASVSVDAIVNAEHGLHIPRLSYNSATSPSEWWATLAYHGTADDGSVLVRLQEFGELGQMISGQVFSGFNAVNGRQARAEDGNFGTMFHATLIFYDAEGAELARVENATDANGYYNVAAPEGEVTYLEVQGGYFDAAKNQESTGAIRVLCLPAEMANCNVTPYASLVMRVAKEVQGDNWTARIAGAESLIAQALQIPDDPAFTVIPNWSDLFDEASFQTQIGEKGENFSSWFDTLAADIADGYLDEEPSQQVFAAGYRRLETTTMTLPVTGGVVKNELGDTMITAPEGSLQEDTEFEISRGFNSLGEFTISISANKDTLGPVEITLPDPDLLPNLLPPEMQPSTGTPRRAVRAAIYPLIFRDSGMDIKGKSFCIGDSWYCKAAHFLKIADGAGKGNRVKNSITGDLEAVYPWGESIYNGIISQIHIATTLSSNCDFNDAACYKDKEPVLFVHGYLPSSSNWVIGGGLGGGEGTWGQFPSRILELDNKYVVFEFRWISAARFEDVAADLGKAIDQIVAKTGKQVHVVAHSFGGVLTRTYLQGFAEDFGYGDSLKTTVTSDPSTGVSKVKNRYIASVTTVGSPHSGITSDPDMTLHGVKFNQGQDSQSILSGEFQINQCEQISCFQMGEYVNFDKTENYSLSSGITRWHKSALSLYGLTYASGSSDGANQLKVKEDATPDPIAGLAGKFSSVLAEMREDHQLPDGLPVQVLIGLASKNNDAKIFNYPEYDPRPDISSGDGLISYEGQRLMPELTVGNVLPLLNQSTQYGGVVTEKILGFGGDIKPGDKNPFSFDRENIDYNYYGYRHSGNPVLNGDSSKPMVNVDCTSNQDCQHATFLAVKEWLTKYPSQPTVPYQTTSFVVKVASAATEKPIPFSFVTFYKKPTGTESFLSNLLFSGRDIFAGWSITGLDGVATKAIRFDPNFTYYAKALAWGYEGEQSTDLIMLDTLDTSPTPDLGVIELLAKDERITLPGRVTDINTNQPLNDVLVIVHNQTPSQDIWRWVFTETDGSFTIEGLLNGDTELFFTKIGYFGEAKSLALQPNESVALNVEMNPWQQGQQPISVNCPRLNVVVSDALTGNPLENVTVSVSEQTQQTDAQGYASFIDLSGVLEVTTQKPGYDSSLNFADPSCVVSQSLNPTGSLDANEVRIILNWGRNPTDLDSHLVGPNETGEFHVFYGNRNGADIAKLDTDDTGSFGPETITISPPTGQTTLRAGTYRYYVHHYSGTATLADSTTVKLILGESEERVFKPLSSATGLAGTKKDVWFVFELNVDASGGVTVNEKQEYYSGISDPSSSLVKEPQ